MENNCFPRTFPHDQIPLWIRSLVTFWFKKIWDPSAFKIRMNSIKLEFIQISRYEQTHKAHRIYNTSHTFRKNVTTLLVCSTFLRKNNLNSYSFVFHSNWLFYICVSWIRISAFHFVLVLDAEELEWSCQMHTRTVFAKCIDNLETIKSLETLPVVCCDGHANMYDTKTY